jgi:hypothetical protein
MRLFCSKNRVNLPQKGVFFALKIGKKATKSELFHTRVRVV